jgi:hypothetical protein
MTQHAAASRFVELSESRLCLALARPWSGAFSLMSSGRILMSLLLQAGAW